MTVHERLSIFWATHELGDLGSTTKRFNLFKVGFMSFFLPNLSKKGYLLHDVNHLLSGYGIDWFSEFELAAWELGSGGRKGFGLSVVYTLIGTAMGFLMIPKRTIKAYKNGLKRVNAHRLSGYFTEPLLKMEYSEIYKSSFR